MPRRFERKTILALSGDQIGVASLDTPGRVRRLRAASTSARYASGHLLYVLDGALLSQAFDTETLTLSGESIPLGLSVSGSSTFYSAFSVSEAGLWSRCQPVRNVAGEILTQMSEVLDPASTRAKASRLASGLYKDGQSVGNPLMVEVSIVVRNVEHEQLSPSVSGSTDRQASRPAHRASLFQL